MAEVISKIGLEGEGGPENGPVSALGGHGRADRAEKRETARGDGAHLEVTRSTMSLAICETAIGEASRLMGQSRGISGREKDGCAQVGLAVCFGLALITASAFSGPALTTGSTGRHFKEDERLTVAIAFNAEAAKRPKRSSVAAAALETESRVRLPETVSISTKAGHVGLAENAGKANGITCPSMLEGTNLVPNEAAF